MSGIFFIHMIACNWACPRDDCYVIVNVWVCPINDWHLSFFSYVTAHIWACPPGEGDDYIFHCHPPEMKIPKAKRLQEWYKKMLDKAIIERVVIDYKVVFRLFIYLLFPFYLFIQWIVIEICFHIC